jgi:hypothetical protein
MVLASIIGRLLSTRQANLPPRVPVEDSHRIHTDVAERRVNGRSMFVAIYLPLPAGDYIIWDPDPERPTRITLKPGIVNELDWR